MATLYEYCNTGDITGHVIYGNWWRGQTFTVGATGHTVTIVKVKIARYGNPGDITLGIRDVDVGTGKPTGDDLTFKTLPQTSVPTTAAFVNFDVTEYALAANKKYAIVLRAPAAGGGSDYYGWRTDNDAPTYPNGSYCYSNNGGSTWTLDVTADEMFEIWGNPLGWGHKIYGIAGASIAKINSVPIASVSKVNTV